jgi:hypothetical protein
MTVKRTTAWANGWAKSCCIADDAQGMGLRRTIGASDPRVIMRLAPCRVQKTLLSPRFTWWTWKTRQVFRWDIEKGHWLPKRLRRLQYRCNFEDFVILARLAKV